MKRGPENFSADELNAVEKPEKRKHSIHIEEWYSEEAEDRAKFLQVASGEGLSNLSAEEIHENQQEFYGIVQDWKRQLPEHGDTVELLEQSGNIKSFVQDVRMSNDREQVDSVRQLCREILLGFEGTWDTLSEREKRSQRMAEIIVLMTDAIKVAQDQREGRINSKSMLQTIRHMERYCTSVDVPDIFKVKFLQPVITRMKGRAGFSVPKPGRKTERRGMNTPNDQGSKDEFWSLRGASDQASSQGREGGTPEYTPPPVSDVEVVKPPKIGLEGVAPAAGEDIVDLTFNPSTKSYDAGGQPAPPSVTPNIPSGDTGSAGGGNNPGVATPPTPSGP